MLPRFQMRRYTSPDEMAFYPGNCQSSSALNCISRHDLSKAENKYTCVNSTAQFEATQGQQLSVCKVHEQGAFPRLTLIAMSHREPTPTGAATTEVSHSSEASEYQFERRNHAAVCQDPGARHLRARR